MANASIIAERADWGRFSARQANKLAAEWDARNPRLAWLIDKLTWIAAISFAIIYWSVTLGFV